MRFLGATLGVLTIRYNTLLGQKNTDVWPHTLVAPAWVFALQVTNRDFRRQNYAFSVSNYLQLQQLYRELSIVTPKQTTTHAENTTPARFG